MRRPFATPQLFAIPGRPARVRPALTTTPLSGWRRWRAGAARLALGLGLAAGGCGGSLAAMPDGGRDEASDARVMCGTDKADSGLCCPEDWQPHRSCSPLANSAGPAGNGSCFGACAADSADGGLGGLSAAYLCEGGQVVTSAGLFPCTPSPPP